MRSLGRRKRVIAMSEAGYLAKYLRISEDDDDMGESWIPILRPTMNCQNIRSENLLTMVSLE